MISKRWATLESVDPETKRFVGKIAAKELGEYKLEMKEYKELISRETADTASASVVEPTVSAVADATASSMMISPSSSPTLSSSSYNMPPTQYYCMPALSADLVLSLDQDLSSAASSSDEDEIDYSICSVGNNGNYIPSPGPSYSSMKTSNMIHPDGSICDPLFELEDNGLETNVQQPYYNKRCVSPVSSDMNVDIFSVYNSFQL